VVHRAEVVSVDGVIDALWGETPPATAAKAVQVYVSRLRRVLGPHGDDGPLVTRPPGYVLQVAPEQTDLGLFERLVGEARAAAAPGGGAAALRQALGLWHGTPLADVAFAPFAPAVARRLEEERLGALEARVEADLALGRAPEVVGELGALIREHPYRERLRAALILALYRAGRQAEALEAYRAARRTFADELGIAPGPALVELERAILRHDRSLAVPQAAAPSPASQQPPAAYLELADAAGAARVAPLPPTGTAFVIGRGAGADLVLDWDDRVSRTHARLERAGPAWTIADGPSRNGTFVNGERVVGPRRLHDRDVVHLGGVSLVFRSPHRGGAGPTVGFTEPKDP
jgi:DNA-binding SARP family transcriptional activator